MGTMGKFGLAIDETENSVISASFVVSLVRPMKASLADSVLCE